MNIDTFSSYALRRHGLGLLAGLLAMALLVSGCDSGGDGKELKNPTNLTVQEVIESRGEISAFKSWVQPNNSNINFGDENSTFTVFLPVNSAFEQLSGDYLNDNVSNLNEVLADHVVQGEAISAADVSQDGDDLVAGNLRLEKASIVTKDLEAKNGIVHFIDQVQLKSLNVRQRVGADLTLQTVGLAATQAGQASTFEDENSSFTVFAPTNAAFAPVNTDALLAAADPGGILQRVIGSHVIQGSALTAGELDGTTQTSLAGHELNFVEGTVDGQAFTTTDIVASNGIIHKLDGVILNQTTATERASITGSLSTLSSLVEAAGLGSAGSPVTVFAPLNSGFAPVDTMALKNADDNLLTRVLGTHIHTGDAIQSGDIDEGTSTTISNQDGGTLTVAKDTSGNVTVNDIPVSTVDLPVLNGVVHLVDQPILSRANVVERAEIMSATTNLAEVLKSRGLASSLENTSNQFTVFAPVNDAFGALNQDNVPGEVSNDVLTYHVHQGSSIMLPADTSVSSVEGEQLFVNEGTVSSDDSPSGEPGLNGAVASATNMSALNGTIHMVDAVLLGRATITERAALEPALSTLYGGLQTVGAAGPLDSKTQTFTVFGPTNGAFGAYKDTLTNDATLLETVLTSHVVAGQEVRSADLENGDQYTSQQAAGDGDFGDLRISVEGPSSFLVNRSQMSVVDVDVYNGVVHLLGDVLLHRTTAVDRALVTPGFGTLFELVDQAGMKSAFNQADRTILAPTNDAFVAALDTNDTEGLQGEEIPTGGQLDSLLQYHALTQALRVRDVPRTQESYTTLVGPAPGDMVGLVRGGDDVVTVDPDSTNPATVTIPDVRVKNGWIQGLDTMLDNR